MNFLFAQQVRAAVIAGVAIGVGLAGVVRAQDKVDDVLEPVLHDVHTLLKDLRGSGAFEPDADAQRRAVLEGIIDALGYGEPHAVRAEEANVDFATSEALSVQTVDLTDWCLYLWFPDLTAKEVEVLTKVVDKTQTAPAKADETGGASDAGAVNTAEDNAPGTPAPASPLGGLIVDVRQCRGGRREAAERVAETLASLEVPVLILIGAETQAAAECMVENLREHASAVTVGHGTRGHPYKLEEKTFPSGVRVRVPRFPTDGEACVARAQVPDIPVAGRANAAERPPFEAGGDRLRRVLRSDPCIQQALDSLTAYRAFSEPHF